MANGCELEFAWQDGYPPTVNDPAMADYVARIARQTLGENRYIPAGRAVMGGEDFAYYLEKVPGCFFLVGVAPSIAPYPSLHSDHYDFTDACAGGGHADVCGVGDEFQRVISWHGRPARVLEERRHGGTPMPHRSTRIL